MRTKWHFDSIRWEKDSEWWKPCVESYRVENERNIGGERRFKTPEEVARASKAHLEHDGCDAFWTCYWLGFGLTFTRY